MSLRYSVARPIPRLHAAAERLPPLASTAALIARWQAVDHVLGCDGDPRFRDRAGKPSFVARYEDEVLFRHE